MPADPDAVAEIGGVVSLQGTAPKPIAIDMSADPGCRGTNFAESLVANDGKLQTFLSA